MIDTQIKFTTKCPTPDKFFYGMFGKTRSGELRMFMDYDGIGVDRIYLWSEINNPNAIKLRSTYANGLVQPGYKNRLDDNDIIEFEDISEEQSNSRHKVWEYGTTFTHYDRNEDNGDITITIEGRGAFKDLAESIIQIVEEKLK